MESPDWSYHVQSRFVIDFQDLRACCSSDPLKLVQQAEQKVAFPAGGTTGPAAPAPRSRAASSGRNFTVEAVPARGPPVKNSRVVSGRRTGY
jgi:hypothetical protein